MAYGIINLSQCLISARVVVPRKASSISGVGSNAWIVWKSRRIKIKYLFHFFLCHLAIGSDKPYKPSLLEEL